MRAVLKAQINKTDRNDARGMAQMMRVGLYRPVHVKMLRSQKLRGVQVGGVYRGGAYRDLLFEAVANLVDNALKFTPEGGRVELVLLSQESETIILSE